MINTNGIFKPKPGAVLNRAHPMSQGLIGLWLFNEGAGLKTKDLVSDQYGTISNMAINSTTSGWIGSPLGGGLQFDGSDDFITFTNNQALQGLTDRVTVIVRFKLVSVAHSFNNVLMKNNANTNFLGVLINSTGTNWQFQLAASTHTGSALTVGNVYECAASWNKNLASNQVRLYTNGVAVAVATNTTALNTSTTNLSFGSDLVNAGRQMNMVLEHCRIYNRDLVEKEIRELYTRPYTGINQRRRFI